MSLSRKYFLKCEQVHRCHLREQDLATKTKDVLVLPAEFLVQPSPHPAPNIWRLCLFTQFPGAQGSFSLSPHSPVGVLFKKLHCSERSHLSQALSSTLQQSLSDFFSISLSLFGPLIFLSSSQTCKGRGCDTENHPRVVVGRAFQPAAPP